MEQAQQPNGSRSAGTRPLEAIVADVEALTRELIDVAGPVALEASGVGGLSGIGSRLTVASPLLRMVCTQLEVLRMTWLSQIERDGRWALDGSRTFRTWLARRAGRVVRVVHVELTRIELMRTSPPPPFAPLAGGRPP